MKEYNHSELHHTHQMLILKNRDLYIFPKWLKYLLKKRRSRYFFQNDQRKSLVAPLPKRQKRHLRLAHHEAGQNGGLSNQWPHEQPTFGPQRYPKSAAWQVTEGWLNMRQQLFVRIVVFSMRNQPERSRRGGFSKVAWDWVILRRS